VWNEVAKDNKCTRCGSSNLNLVLGNGVTTSDGYTCRGCGLYRPIEKNNVLPEVRKAEPDITLTIEERAMVQLIEIAEDPNNEPLVRIEACKIILGR